MIQDAADSLPQFHKIYQLSPEKLSQFAVPQKRQVESLERWLYEIYTYKSPK